jgi:hypothetical protein
MSRRAAMKTVDFDFMSPDRIAFFEEDLDGAR